jgi:hypothetical protein
MLVMFRLNRINAATVLAHALRSSSENAKGRCSIIPLTSTLSIEVLLRVDIQMPITSLQKMYDSFLRPVLNNLGEKSLTHRSNPDE